MYDYENNFPKKQNPIWINLYFENHQNVFMHGVILVGFIKARDSHNEE